MNLLLDTNIILDVLIDRQPFSELGADLFDLAYEGKVKLYISALSYPNIYYILRKTGTHATRISQLQDLDTLTHTLEVTAAIITKSLKSNFKDFEDAIQYYAALSAGNIDAIVTRNGTDFRESSLSRFYTRGGPPTNWGSMIAILPAGQVWTGRCLLRCRARAGDISLRSQWRNVSGLGEARGAGGGVRVLEECLKKKRCPILSPMYL